MSVAGLCFKGVTWVRALAYPKAFMVNSTINFRAQSGAWHISRGKAVGSDNQKEAGKAKFNLNNSRDGFLR